jgi:hypothetical protein
MLTCAIFPIQNKIACLKLLSHLISKYFPCISRLLTMRVKPKHICIVSPHSEMFAWSLNMFFVYTPNMFLYRLKFQNSIQLTESLR